MKKYISIIAICLSFMFDASAQKITNAGDLKKYYMEYLSNLVSDKVKTNALVKAYCTQKLYAAWNEDVNEIGVYDPFTNGYHDPVMTRKTLQIQNKNDIYMVSFDYQTWPDNKTETEKILVFINSDGKIWQTKRPSDGYVTPNE